MRLNYSRDQWMTIVSALIFLAGGVFMLVNVFGGYTWSFVVGISLAVVASAIMCFAMWDHKRQVRKHLEKNAPKEEKVIDAK